MTDSEQADPATFGASHGQTIRATSIIGGASIVNIALGLIRMKIAAIILGPVGVGMIGLLQNLLNAAATVGGLNLRVAGARQIVASESAGGEAAAAAARRAVCLTASVLAVASGLLLWLVREPLARLLFEDPTRAGQVGWLAIGVAATAVAGYQTAILTARRRIGDLARVSVLSAAAAALVGSVSILVWKADGLVPFILAAPLATFAFGWIFVRRLPAARGAVAGPDVLVHIRPLVGLGTALTVSIFVTLCGQLAIRTLVEHRLGAVALGHFQAAWTITSVYLVFIFQAMASDYVPRLTTAMHDQANVQQLVDGQAEVGILLAAPVLLTMIGAAPWVLSILYSGEFVEASALLRYQMLGDMLRLASWPIAFVLLAGKASREYVLIDITGTAILVAASFVLLPFAGLAAPGIAYIIMNLGYGALILFIVRRKYAVGLGGRVTRMFALLAASCVLIFAISAKFALAGAVASAILACLWAAFAYFRLGFVKFLQRSKPSR